MTIAIAHASEYREKGSIALTLGQGSVSGIQRTNDLSVFCKTPTNRNSQAVAREREEESDEEDCSAGGNRCDAGHTRVLEVKTIAYVEPLDVYKIVEAALLWLSGESLLFLQMAQMYGNERRRSSSGPSMMKHCGIETG